MTENFWITHSDNPTEKLLQTVDRSKNLATIESAMSEKIPSLSLEKLHRILKLICTLYSEYGLKMAFYRGLSHKERIEKRILEKSYDLVYEKIKQKEKFQ